ncbi:uncharacterized protein LOC114331963 [Diabrotica virgifera virgifera]|uniref:Inositol-1-monophosphatase n=1 Tax=Diabrotica virgifera virgifera TaxID=50390 RepID=A0A6P7FRP6_DIAVI|nr:uncharacterized protein LOC114331963 [Diabrotica virgifera virgifera]
MDSVQEYYDFVLPLIKEAGQVLLHAKNYKIETKGEIYDEVTEFDRRIEEVLIKKIKERWPSHSFIGEEESHINGIGTLTDNPTWIIDPIDGTANFVRNLKDSCVSVGLVINKVQTMGLVFNPFLNELYTAIKGQGAYLNGKRIYVSKETNIMKAIFNYEVSLARNPKYYELYMYRLKHLIQIINGFRSLGSAVMGLCYVASGRVDAYQCDGLYPWDAAAGVLIVREAGGTVCDSRGCEFNLMDPNFLATSTKELSDKFMEIERKADDERLRDMKNGDKFQP